MTKMRSFLVVSLLCCAAAAQAAVYKVGPTGSYSTLDAALEDAARTPGSHEVRIASGTRHELTSVSFSIANQVVVSGGWDPAFTSPWTTGPTILDGGGAEGRVLSVWVRDAKVAVRNLTIRNGLTALRPGGIPFAINAVGGGFLASARGAGELELSSLVATGNRIQIGLPHVVTWGAGGYVGASDTARVRIVSCTFSSNVISRDPGLTTGNSAGAGLYVELGGSATVEIRRNTVSANRTEGPGGEQSGMTVRSSSAAPRGVLVLENRIHDNVVEGGGGVASGLGLRARGDVSQPAMEARRNVLSGNRGARQLDALALDTAGLVISDSVVAEGPDGGVRALATGGAGVGLTHLTVVRNEGVGVEVSREGTAEALLLNTIAFDNATDTALGAGVFALANRFGVDPLFQPGSSYRLTAASPMRDAGTSAGSLQGTLDVDLGPRVVGPRVDIGADEFKP
jgi:hypothetical protein